ncbi:sugar ABC transporter permease [soil metagenome]
MSAVEAPLGHDAEREPRQSRSLANQEARIGYAFVAPALIVVLVVVAVPIVWNIALSFQDLRLVELQDFNFFSTDVSLDNYDRVTSGDFFSLLLRTFIYAVAGTTVALLLGLWAALVVRRAFPGRRVVRGLLLFPYVVPVVAAALLWRTMLNPQFGIVNGWLESVGGQPVNFLLQRDGELFGFKVPLAFTVVVLFEGWRSFPFAFLFILARLQAMPKELDEAAIVDGATVTQRFRYIVMPALKGVFATIFLLRFIWTFNAFDEVFLLTGGAAGTELVSIEVVNWLFGRSNVGAAAALSIVLAAALGITLAVYFRWFYPKEEPA